MVHPLFAEQGNIQLARLEALLVDLVDIYSPSNDEKALLDFLETRIKEADLPSRRQPVDGGLYNLIVTLTERPPELFLIGHIDTISRHHSKDHRARIEGRKLFGLGAADMKSGIAAMLEAFCVLRSLYPTTSASAAPAVGLALLVDEEDGGSGAATFVREYLPQMAVLGEPTDLRLCHRHYGYCELSLSIRGKRAHSAIPEYGQNAILTMMDLVQSLYRLPPPDGFDEVGWSHLNLRELIGNNAYFAVPEDCDACLDFHLHPALEPTHFCAWIDDAIARFHAKRPQVQIQADWLMRFAGFGLSSEDPFLSACRNVAMQVGLAPSFEVFRSHSDANLLHQNGIRCVMMGPGALGTAHTIHEVVDLDDLAMAARFYLGLLRTYRSSCTSSGNR